MPVYLRKVEPLSEVLDDFDSYVDGRKRYQGGQRTGIPVVEVEGKRLSSTRWLASHPPRS